MHLWTRLLAALGFTHHDDLVADELEAHRAHTQDELERAGWSPDAAARESRRRMGNATLAREDSRDVWIVRSLDRLKRNLRYGARGLRREPTFAVTAIVTLALGTAAVTSVFSVADAELWRRLPYPHAEQLVVVRSLEPATQQEVVDRLSLDELLEWRRAIPALASIAAQGDQRRQAVRLDGTQAMRTQQVTANFFTTLGRHPIAGRVFTDADARGSNAVVLGSRGWERGFNRDPAIVGRVVFIDNTPHVVVGIVPADDTTGGAEADLFLPIDEGPGATAVTYAGIGRLAPGATAEIVRAQAQTAIDRRAAIDKTRTGHRADVWDISAFFRRSDARPLYFFLGASVFVLILTIVNVAGLVLARGVRRAPEFALRGALGGGTRVIMGQLAAEGALVALPGCLAGLWIAHELMGMLSTIVPSQFLWRGAQVPIDYRAVVVVAFIVLVTILGLALAPLGVARRADPSLVKVSGGRGSGSPKAGRMRERLLVTQVALSLVLLVGGALLLKSFVALTREPLGFDAADGWSMHVSLSSDRYRDVAAMRQYSEALRAQAEAIPGVRSVSIANSSPLMSGWLVLSTPPGATPDPARPGTRAIYRAVDAGYFTTIGTRLTRGRAFSNADVAGAPAVAVVNENFVRQFFHDADPIGRTIAVKGFHAPVPLSTVTVVGVAANIKEVGLNEVDFADIYVPFAQHPVTDIELIVRGNGRDAGMPATMRAAAAKADPSMPVSSVQTLDRRVAAALEEDRFNLIVAGGFAILALIIAGIGVYGAMAYAASARAREFGVRLALGASPRTLLGGALWYAVRFGVTGGVLGVVVALLAAVWIGDALYLVPGDHNGLLFHVKTTDPSVFAGAAGVILVVAILAGFIPARRLARVDPVKTLRAE